MKCYSPMSIPRPNGTGSTDRITIPCNKCVACLSRKRTQMAFRLAQELKVANSAHFITLTYAPEYLRYDDNGNPSVNKRDVQLFLKRLRKTTKNKLRYYLTAEYGEKTLRPHYHMILFNLDYDLITVNKKVESSWQLGQIDIGTVTPKSINYVTKYVFKKSSTPNYLSGVFNLMSRNPGIGAHYLKSHSNYHAGDQEPKFHAVTWGGRKVALPRYYVERMFSEETRRRHAEEIQQFDEQQMIQEMEDFKLKNPDQNFYRYQLDLINKVERVSKNNFNNETL